MPIPNVAAVVAGCWASAEEATLELLADRHWDQDEEFITELFRGEFRRSVESLAETDVVAEAFLWDLKARFPLLSSRIELRRLATGVSATTTWHPREIERKTGGDLGIVIVRPSVDLSGLSNQLNIYEDYARGLLCQAKINRRTPKRSSARWGSLTARQKKVLPERTDYLALLLYRYSDVRRRSLEPFQWQLCEHASLHDIDGWLKEDVFPELLSSENVIEQLGNDRIGADDRSVIDEYVAPDVRDALTIRIGWPPGDRPPDTLSIAMPYRVRRRQRLRLRI